VSLSEYHNIDFHNAECHCVECHYPKSHHAECRGARWPICLLPSFIGLEISLEEQHLENVAFWGQFYKTFTSENRALP